jgi:hypothetical protein
MRIFGSADPDLKNIYSPGTLLTGITVLRRFILENGCHMDVTVEETPSLGRVY